MPTRRNICGSPHFRRRASIAILGAVPTYVIETYLSRARPDELDAAAARLRAVAEPPVRHVRSFFVPEDETCFHVVEGPSPDAIRAVSRRARITPDRIVEAESA